MDLQEKLNEVTKQMQTLSLTIASSREEFKRLGRMAKSYKSLIEKAKALEK